MDLSIINQLLTSTVSVLGEGKDRLPKYGEVFRKTVAGGKATIIVRGVFQQRSGDSYHVRVLAGKGDPSAEHSTPRKSILFKDDYYLGGYQMPDDPKGLLKAAVKGAMDWIKSPAGKKKLSKVSAQ